MSMARCVIVAVDVATFEDMKQADPESGGGLDGVGDDGLDGVGDDGLDGVGDDGLDGLDDDGPPNGHQQLLSEIERPRTRWVWKVACSMLGLATVVLAVVALSLLVERRAFDEPQPQAGVRIRSAFIPRGVGSMMDPTPIPETRTVDAYRGYGAWVDVFDYSPPYAGDSPSVTPADLDVMAAEGVDTVYLQAARADQRSPEGIQDRWLLAEMLIGAHERGMAVVAWYLPKWKPDGRDLERMRLLDEFEAFGHRFDGVAVDIEWNDDGLTPSERSARLVAFSRLAAERNDGPLGAIVLPPVQIEVVNPAYWPNFPWGDLSPLYDVWLPMSYWSFRSGDYGDGYKYYEESVRRLRANIGDDAALVHGVGGIGGTHEPGAKAGNEPLATMEEIVEFMRALEDTDSIGGSIYDWRTLTPQVRAELVGRFSEAYGT